MAEEVEVKHKYYHSGDEAPLVLFFTGWDLNGKIKTWQYEPFVWILKFSGFNVLLLSYSNNILKPHPDPKDHRERFLNAYEKVRKISESYINKSSRVMIFGTSFGSTLGFKLGSEFPEKVEKIVLNLFLSDVVEGLWYWKPKTYRMLTSDFLHHTRNRDNYQKHVADKESVYDYWDVLNFDQYVSKYDPKKTKLLLYLAEGDALARYEVSKYFLEDLEARGFDFKTDIKGKRWGHLSAGAYNLINFRKWLGFLKKN